MRWLAAVMRICRPRRVLELGSGIGTLTELMLRSAGEIERLYAVEPHTQCLDLLRKNLAPYDPKLVFIASEAELTGVEKPIELIVGDGGFYSPLEFLNAEEGRFFSLKV
jgi:16S rRNA A1518/A1519 N6-dimethyltransferase RsmA/KsgA/DIM1 with predicted DNA glycosylase/AP lyase activity